MSRATAVSGMVLAELREELKIIDGTLTEITGLQDYRFFKEKRMQTLDDYLDALYSRYDYDSMPEREKSYLDRQIVESRKLNAREAALERQASRWQGTKRSGSALRRAAAIGIMLFGSLGQTSYDVGKVAEEASRRAPHVAAAIHAQPPSSSAIAEYKFKEALKGTYGSWFVASSDTFMTSLEGWRYRRPGKGSRDHPGIDVRAQPGNAALAIADVRIEYRSGTEIGMRTPGDTLIVYNHVRSRLRPGDVVPQGGKVGVVVLEGEPNLHVEVYDQFGNRVDPYCTLAAPLREFLIGRYTLEGKPSGFRYRTGTSVREKLENSCEQSAARYALEKAGVPLVQFAS